VGSSSQYAVPQQHGQPSTEGYDPHEQKLEGEAGPPGPDLPPDE